MRRQLQTNLHKSPDSIDVIEPPGELAEPWNRSARAAEKITALGEMSRGIAHDLRNVLSMLTSGLNIAEADAGDPAKLMAALDAMRDGIARGLKITNRLLDFARQQELKPGFGDINALLSAQKLFLSYGAGPGIRVALELTPGLPDCLVDPPQLNAAMLNLIVNARDAMPAGGVIRISTALSHLNEKGHPHDYVRIRVRDTGSGMPPNILAKVFDPFFTTKGDGGTGMGVPQVQRLMRQVGGCVAIHSTVGKGTVFDLFFPVERNPLPVTADSRQLDRWADEGGAIAPPALVDVAP